ncbi:TRAP transporter large permease subunit [Oricola sp.]|uniref:TRAP transporter large permease n=1 Tax=Oricola sp. TaxID=1979950 RepID=UPI0025F70D8F|nr:TRAP transporter large permease subunit [Oricola sp.]MCI5075400.1 TRAP transporter large permease subunit [Oricola sp.]
MTFAIGCMLLVALIVLGIPVGYALGLAGIGSLLLVTSPTTIAALMTKVVHSTASNYVILTIPMFVLMAELLSAGGVAQDLMVACARLTRRVRGGLAMACVLAGAVLASASGSSTASSASIARAAFPSMKAAGYRPGFAVGVVAISGTLAIMIPPSIAFVVYGLMTDASIGKLFIAGIIPGILTAAGYMATISLAMRFRPDLGPSAGDASLDLLPQSAPVWPIALLILIVLGSLYGGVATPTEVAAIGALGALLVSSATGRMTRGAFFEGVGNTLRTTAMIVTIIFGAHLFGYFVSFSRIADTLLGWIGESGLPPYAVMLMVVGMYLLLGMVMDQMAIIILTAPVTHALMTGLGYDEIWFGVVMVKTAEIGLVTPPMGLNVYIAASATRTELRQGFLGIMPFIVFELLILALLLAVPDLVLWLPG